MAAQRAGDEILARAATHLSQSLTVTLEATARSESYLVAPPSRRSGTCGCLSRS